MTAAALLVIVGLAGVALGIWSTLGLHALATRHRPPTTCILANVPADAPAGLAKLLAAETRPASTPKGRNVT